MAWLALAAAAAAGAALLHARRLAGRVEQLERLRCLDLDVTEAVLTALEDDSVQTGGRLRDLTGQVGRLEAQLRPPRLRSEARTDGPAG